MIERTGIYNSHALFQLLRVTCTVLVGKALRYRISDANAVLTHVHAPLPWRNSDLQPQQIFSLFCFSRFCLQM